MQHPLANQQHPCLDAPDDPIEWSAREMETMRQFDRPAVKRPVASPHVNNVSPTKAAVKTLSAAVDQASRNERRVNRRYQAAASKHARGSTGVARTKWEDKNRLDDHAFTIATLVGDCLTAGASALQSLRDEMRVAASQIATFGAAKISSADLVPKFFDGSSGALLAIERGFRELMPLLSSSATLEEPLHVLKQVHTTMVKEMALPLACTPDHFLERWRAAVAKRLAAADESPLRPAETGANQVSPRVSTITDKTPLAYEMLLTPRTLLPVPPPVYRPFSGSAPHTPKAHRPVHIVQKVQQIKQSLYEKHGVALECPQVKVEPSPLLNITSISTPRRVQVKTAAKGSTRPRVDIAAVVPGPVDPISLPAEATGNATDAVVEPLPSPPDTSDVSGVRGAAAALSLSTENLQQRSLPLEASLEIRQSDGVAAVVDDAVEGQSTN